MAKGMKKRKSSKLILKGDGHAGKKGKKRF
jgi:hypothetical protein